MKKHWALLVFVLALSPQVFARRADEGTNPLLRWIAQVRVLREVALETLLEDRCSRYLKYSEHESCYEAVDQKIAILDFDILMGKDKATPVLMDKNDPGSFVFVAFKTDLLRLLADPKTTAYLELVNTELSAYINGVKKDKPNLWNISVSYFGSPFEAARAHAVLFQDTSPVKLHLAYLEWSGQRMNTPSFDGNRQLLSQTIDIINMVMDSRGDNFQELFIPNAVQGKLHRTIYHFYVPTYLSMALQKKGISPRFAFIAPLMMTLTYEFVTAGQDYRYLFADPEKVEDWSLGDIFGGYNGASFGTNRMNKVVPFADLRKAFDVSTENGLATLLK
ncbi:MAG: hypothetical protein ACJ76H_15175 [Bacteriovoracaceae bacterium]